jgi:hypothetical protein
MPWSCSKARWWSALTVENTMVGRISPASMLNESYTRVVTVVVASSAAGGAGAGVLADQVGVPWAVLFAGGAVAAIAVAVTEPDSQTWCTGRRDGVDAGTVRSGGSSE